MKKHCAALVLFIAFGNISAFACDCGPPNVKRAAERMGVIFRGTIVQIRKPSQKGQKPIAVFRVSRVWKGDVGPSFEMPAIEERSDCAGFWPNFLKVGNELVVFAFKLSGDHEYYQTSVCLPTTMAAKSSVTVELGPGYPPRSDQISH